MSGSFKQNNLCNKVSSSSANYFQIGYDSFAIFGFFIEIVHGFTGITYIVKLNSENFKKNHLPNLFPFSMVRVIRGRAAIPYPLRLAPSKLLVTGCCAALSALRSCTYRLT